ncbi:hypothetical protein [Bacteroides nordii]|jgi:hypothetical protein|uniref:hypothetical protein n=1 Tax=Bacteroides nordii TaxID=291645 RepID=UPI00242EB043|nr:hypothetical protein [Bacteroides nordii]
MIRVENSFANIETDWNRLYNYGNYSVFQSYAYNKISFDYIQKKKVELYLLCYRNPNNQLQAILPTYLYSGELSFINDRNTDFCDIIIDENAKKHDIFSELFDFIQHDDNVKSITLDNIRPGSLLLPYFRIYSRSSLIYCINEYSYLSCCPLANVYDNFCNLNNDKKKKLKKIVATTKEYTFQMFKKKLEHQFPKKQLLEISSVMVKKGLRSANTFNDSFWSFVEACFDSNLIEIGILEEEGNPVSAGMVFFNKNISVRWVILYTEPKYNLWNNTHYIINKCSTISSNYEINFGRGGYDYKINNFKPELSLLYRLSYSKTICGGISQTFKALFYFFKLIIKPIIRR